MPLSPSPPPHPTCPMDNCLTKRREKMRRIAALAVLLPTLGCQAQHDPASSDPTSAIAESLSLPPARVWTILDDLVLAPFWAGNGDHGTLFGPLWRSALPGI